MHAFSADGAHVLVLDGYGLTRASLDGRAVRPVDGITGNALVRSGALVAARGSYESTRVVRVDKLSSPTRKKPELFGVVPHPDGQHLIGATVTKLEIKTLEGDRVAELPIHCGSPRSFPLGRSLPEPDPMLPDELSIDDEGTLAIYSHRAGALVRVRLPDVYAALEPSLSRRVVGSSPTIDGLRIDVRSPVGRVHVAVARGIVMLCAHVPSTSTAEALLVLADGSMRPIGRASLDRLAFDGTALAWQPDEDTVAVETLDGDEQRLAIPLEHRGPGEVMLDGEHVLFVPRSRESIVDLRTARVTSRKLPVAELEARTAIGQLITQTNERGHRYDVVVALESLRSPGDPEIRPQFDWSCGDQSLFAALVIGGFIAEMLLRWRPVSMSPVVIVTTTDADELARGLASLEELGIVLLRALPFCAHAFEHSIGARIPYRPPSTTQRRRIFAPEVGVRFLRAVVAAGSGTTDPREVDLAELTRISATDAPVSAFGDDLRSALAWVLVETLEERAWPTLFDWLVVAPNPYADANTYNASSAAVRLCDLHPGAKAPLRDACTRASRSNDPNQARRAADVLRAIDAPP